ncbi:Crp/Fnr family transcriptional regulator [Tenacibaculum sp. S7007]|uniref:Crp/Fnr family transcriptional regulator n=1 Tax=Tenacibaculum pelagium TaxID=2759527 RepID=A0A839ANH8_9FLAO|nr:Crp/Fnr family transcriptional regulator [Tenacibaculum pelagium]MBA6156643.1 Crp/Fnr family transcriptional regulator [Tenacibaculum pelagium]
MDFFRAFANEHTKVSEESLKEFQNLFSVERFGKKFIIAPQGKVQKYFYLVQDGLVRSYIIDENGSEYTRSIFTKYSVVCSLPSLVYELPSNAEYQCLTDCIVLKANFKELKKLTEKHHDLCILYSKVLEKVYTRIENRLTNLATLDATESYLRLKKVAPNIENKIPQYQIASYLNITPIQLSRIRKKLASGES